MIRRPPRSTLFPYTTPFLPKVAVPPAKALPLGQVPRRPPRPDDKPQQHGLPAEIARRSRRERAYFPGVAVPLKKDQPRGQEPRRPPRPDYKPQKHGLPPTTP